jgi:hypothetical protein
MEITLALKVNYQYSIINVKVGELVALIIDV